MPPLTSMGRGHNANPFDQNIYISTPSITDVTFTIKPVGQLPGSYITGTVSVNKPFHTILVPYGNGQLFQDVTTTSVITNDKGYIIEATGNIYVSIRMKAGETPPFHVHAGAIVSKGTAAPGKRFRVGTFANQHFKLSPTSFNFVSVMATQDGTEITFSDFENGMIIDNYKGNTPILATEIIKPGIFNRGESYIIGIHCNDTDANRDGLIGVLIESNKPIVVNTGSTTGSFSNDPGPKNEGTDYGIDQIVDTSKIGKEYIFIRGAGSDDTENVLLVADTNNTDIFINGITPKIATINQGEHYIIEGNYYGADGNMYVETSEPVFAYQGVGGLNTIGKQSDANQGMFFVPPLNCEATGDLFSIAQVQDIGGVTYDGGITIVTEGSVASPSPMTVYEDSIPIDLAGVNVNGPFNVPGKPGYITYKILGLNGNISVDSGKELYVAYFNSNLESTSGSFYAGFPAPPEIIFQPEISNYDYCIPNAVLEAANITSFSTFEFQLLNETTGVYEPVFVGDPNTPADAFFSPTVSGTYRVQGVLVCTNLLLISSNIFVSFCPEDYDGDGIIDNIDIDDDNDGITDCGESRGNADLDLSDGNEKITLLDGTIIPFTSSRLIEPGNTFTASPTGIISSVLGTGINKKNEYKMSFTQPVNVKLTEKSIPTPSLPEETYIVRILPNTKTITIVDPDDRLLVDTNVDGGFETGITVFSSSEIHFKINPTPKGNTPFKFHAKRVVDFEFIHQSANEFLPSSFLEGELSLTCYANDFDMDGVPDDYDLDSDNDGIPDIIENVGQNVALLNTDVDGDGLDDVFESGFEDTLLDSDSDGIPDFYDLDSDNDGIFDLIESVSDEMTQTTFPDSDNNGIIDGNLFGVNGWYDLAETAAESNIIRYVVRNVDGDLEFNYIDSDSDNDGCFDVIEAGFTDLNEDGFLGNNTPIVNTLGTVINAIDGYTIPKTIDYLIYASIAFTNHPVDVTLCPDTNTLFSFNATTDNIGIYQWEVNTGSTWTPILDNLIYSGSQTNTLNITNAPLSFNNYSYRLSIQVAGNSCLNFSDPAVLQIIEPIDNPDQEHIICVSNNESVFLEIPSIFDTSAYTYEWGFSPFDDPTTKTIISTEPNFNAFEPGNYTITLDSGVGCSKQVINHSVLGVYQPSFNDDAITVLEFTHEDNWIKIDPNMITPTSSTYQYALVPTNENGIPLNQPNYKNSPNFTDIEPGYYALYVRNINNICDPSLLNITILGIPKYFTPNGDGVNDRWTLKGLNKFKYPNTAVYVYDRHGKLLKQLSLNDNPPGWDGNYTNAPMPSNDYWYRVVFENGREIIGHFALKR